MKQLRYQVRYALPIWLIGLLTSLLPENRFTQAWRGRLLSSVINTKGALRVARGVQFVNVERLFLGRGVYLGPGVWMNALGGLTIGDEVMLGPYVCVSTTEHGFSQGSVARGGTHIKPVSIGAGSWLGAHSVVTPGVDIGSSTLVGANAVVTRSFENDAVIAGVPARFIRTRIDNPGTLGGRSAF